MELGKSRGGRVCLMVNSSWCNSTCLIPLMCYCTPNLEILTIKYSHFYLPLEFTSVIVSAVYIPPQTVSTTFWNIGPCLDTNKGWNRKFRFIGRSPTGRTNLWLLCRILLDEADWDMLKHSSDDINEFMEGVVGFIWKLMDDAVHKPIIRTFPNQKLWVDKTIHDALR